MSFARIFNQFLSARLVQLKAQDDSPLTTTELKAFRGLLGGLLWLCQTRLDAIADTVIIQQNTASATIKHIKMANTLLARVKKYAKNAGLYFPKISPPFVIDTVADSSGATSGSSYAQEAVLILLGSDKRVQVVATTSIHYQQVCDSKQQLSKFCHIIASLSHKAKRVSGSTSRAETLAGVVGKELAQMIAMRLTELFAPGIQLPLHDGTTMSQLIQIQDNAEFAIPIDHWTDSRDFFRAQRWTQGCTSRSTPKIICAFYSRRPTTWLYQTFLLVSYDGHGCRWVDEKHDIRDSL